MCNILLGMLNDTDLLRTVTCEDAVRMLYSPLPEAGGLTGKQPVDQGLQLLLAERRRPGTPDLLPILLLGVVESQASCCRNLAGSLTGWGVADVRLSSQQQLFEAAANDSASLAEQLAIQCAMLSARVAASGPGRKAEGRTAAEGLAAEIGEAADLGLQLTQSVQELFPLALSFQANAGAINLLSSRRDIWLKPGSPPLPSAQELATQLAMVQRGRMGCIQAFSWDWGLLHPALSWAIASEQTLPAITGAFFTGRLSPYRLEQLLLEHGQLPECGSSACPNVAGFSLDNSSNGPQIGWAACELCGTWFCCRGCRDKAKRVGHEELCVLLRCGRGLHRPSGEQNDGSEEGGSSQDEPGGGSVDTSSADEDRYSDAGGSDGTLPVSPGEDEISTGSSEEDSACAWQGQGQRPQLHSRAHEEPEEEHAAVLDREIEEGLARHRADINLMQEGGTSDSWDVEGQQQQQRLCDDEGWQQYDDRQYNDAAIYWEEAGEGGEGEGQGNNWEPESEREDAGSSQGSQADGEQVTEATVR